MELKQLKHDFQNNYLRIEVLFGLINEGLVKEEKIPPQYLEDFEIFLKLALEHLDEIKSRR